MRVAAHESSKKRSTGYTVNLSSNNSGTFSQSTITIGGGGGSPSFTYTPTAVGNHTLTATITDLEGKSKTVNAVAQCDPSSINADWLAFPSGWSGAGSVPTQINITSRNQYPAGAPFRNYTGLLIDNSTTLLLNFIDVGSIGAGGQRRYEATVAITDMWGKTKNEVIRTIQ